MKTQISKNARLITVMCTVVYFASYIMRINFAAMLVKIGADMNVPKTELAIIVTALTITYGAGQIISGFLGDKLPAAHMITAGLAIACACNVAMFFCDSIPIMTVIWGINGAAHSMLWPPIVRIMSTTLNEVEYSYCSVSVYRGSSVATIVIYLLCPWLMGTLGWRYVLLICAVAGAIIAAVWVIVNPKFMKNASNTAVSSKTQKNDIKKEPIPSFVFIPLIMVMIGIASQGMLRDGVTNWMPSLLLETFGLSEENAIVSTVILAVFSILSFMLFNFIHMRFFRNEVTCGSVIFAASAVSATLMLISNLMFSSVVLSVVLMGVIVSCMHGVNLMLITIVPRRFVRSGRVSTVSGILNSCTYVGSSIATYAFAAIAENSGWNATILSWVIISVVGFAVCAVASPMWKKFRSTYADKP